MRYLAAFGLALVFVVSAPVVHADSHVQRSADFIDSLANRAVAMMEDTSLSDEERRERFRALFREGFAVSGIARFAAGRYWRSAPKADREEYLKLFEQVVVNVWSDRIFSQYKGQPFEILRSVDNTPPRSKEKVALVQSRIEASPTTSVIIEWRVNSNDTTIKITDVLVEGASLATAQRDDWAEWIRKNGKKLSSLNKRLAEQGS